MSQKQQPSKPKPDPQSPSAAKVAQPDPAEKKTLDGLLTKLEKARGHKVIVYWTSDGAKISHAVEVPLYDQLKMIGPQSDLDLVIFTRGGVAETPGRVVSLIREYCDRLHILIPFRCHSAGTAIAMGGDSIVMTPLSVLGPIDPSRTHPLLPMREGADAPEPISVQDMRHAMQFIAESAQQLGGEPDQPWFRQLRARKSQARLTPEAMAQIFEALFNKIHPLAIGAIEQSYALAKLVGMECLRSHMSDESKIRRIVDKLCDEYKSHDYPIGRAEARKIGLKVCEATDDEEALLGQILQFYNGRSAAPVNLNAGDIAQLNIAWLDSLHNKFRVEAKYRVSAELQLEFLQDRWVSY